MTEKTTVENYTDAMVKRLHEVYQPEDSEEDRTAQMETLSDELGKGVKSIRAKLVHEKLYVKKVYVKKTGDKPETKETIVKEIARTLGVDADSSLSGLEKATKNCLILLRGTIKAASDLVASAEASEAEKQAE